jgi:Alternate to MurJ
LARALEGAEVEYLISFFMALAILAETIGVWGRYIGASSNESALGYSTHVRIATIGRGFTLISAPALGYFVDNGLETRGIVFVGFLTYALTTICGLLIFKYGQIISFSIYKMMNSEASTATSMPNLNTSKTEVTTDVAYNIFVGASYAMTTIGVIVVNIVASIFHEQRATIVQTSAAITAAGTALHVFFIDPKMASAADKNLCLLNYYVKNFVIYRTWQSLLLTLAFLTGYVMSH